VLVLVLAVLVLVVGFPCGGSAVVFYTISVCAELNEGFTASVDVVVAASNGAADVVVVEVVVVVVVVVPRGAPAKARIGLTRSANSFPPTPSVIEDATPVVTFWLSSRLVQQPVELL
jgi:hypothetical protein